MEQVGFGIDARDLMSVVLSSGSIGVAVLDRELRYLALNRALATINGLPIEAHIGQTVHDVLKDAAGRFEPLLRHVLRTGETLANVEISAVLPTRTAPAWWLLTYFPIKDEAGLVERVGGVVVENVPSYRRHRFFADLGLREASANDRDSQAALNPANIGNAPRHIVQAPGVVEKLASGEATVFAGRKLEVLKLLAEGMSNKEVAAALGISVRTVENHRATILTRLGLRSVADLVRYAIQKGIIEP